MAGIPPQAGQNIAACTLQEVKLPLRHCDGRVQALQMDAMQLTAADLRQAKAAAGQCSTLDRFHVVLSDMCHSTLGVAAADVARSLQLAHCAASIAIGHSALEGTLITVPFCLITPSKFCPRCLMICQRRHWAAEACCMIAEEEPEDEEGGLPKQGLLLPEGHLVAKLLQGEGSDAMAKDLRKHFRKVAWMQPKATRSESREMYLVALGRKPM